MKRFRASSLGMVCLVASGVFWVACQPQPTTTAIPSGPTQEQLERARADSIRAAEALAAVRRAREQAIADSIRAAEAARLARAKVEEEARRRAAEEAARRAAELKPVYFDYDQYTIREDHAPELVANAKSLKEYQPTSKVVIEGHCDERGTVEYNLALGERRANAVKRYLIDLGIDPGRLSTVSYGENHPVDPGQDETAWAKNRRVELKRQPELISGRPTTSDKR